MEQGADPKAFDLGRPPIMHAAIHGHSDCIRALLPLSTPGLLDAYGMTSLMHAADNGHADCAAALLSHDNPLAKDRNGHTALMHACRSDSPDCALALIHGSELFAKDLDGFTALDLAAESGAANCVDLLLPYFSHDLSALSRAQACSLNNDNPSISERIAACSLAMAESIELSASAAGSALHPTHAPRI